MTHVAFYCPDAAARIADLIEEEESKLKLVTRKRDQHRGDTTIRALKEALELVLLERQCKDGNSHPMPDVKEYMARRKHTPAA